MYRQFGSRSVGSLIPIRILQQTDSFPAGERCDTDFFVVEWGKQECRAKQRGEVLLCWFDPSIFFRPMTGKR